MPGQLIGGIVGGIANNGDEDRAKAAREKALAAIEGIKLPSVEEQQIALQDLVSAGQLSPEMLETIMQESSAMEGISADPRLRSAQLTALEKLTQQGQEGLTASDRLAMNQIQKGNERDASARNASILQNMAQRGMAGSGAELAAQMMSSQAATENAQNQGMNLAAQAQQRALEATAQGANVASQVRGQDFDQAAQVAKARDAINQFNAANRQNVAATNVGQKNQAQAANLQNSQRISDTNIGTKNNQQVYNKELIQKNFQNQTQLGGLKNQAYTGAANQHQANADATAAKWAGIGKSADETAVAAMSMFSDENVKKNVSKGDDAIEGFLNKLQAYNYEYKNPEHGQGERAGIMAQDAEKSDLGEKLVKESPEGKQIDVSKGLSAMLAAAANLNKRLNKLEGKE
jgi:hypothetical protein